MSVSLCTLALSSINTNVWLCGYLGRWMWMKPAVDVCLCHVKRVHSGVCACPYVTMRVWWGHQLIRETDGVGPGGDNPIRSLKRRDRPRSRKYDLIMGTLWPCAERPVPGGWQVCTQTHTHTTAHTHNKPGCLEADTTPRATLHKYRRDCSEELLNALVWGRSTDIRVVWVCTYAHQRGVGGRKEGLRSSCPLTT